MFGFEVWVRPRVAIFFLFNINILNNRSKILCLKNGSDRLRKGEPPRRNKIQYLKKRESSASRVS